ncbi:MAG: Fic family protein [Chloroflexi bacterium]|nr:Fic family protein [Chloroflexota bacterium]
MLDRRLLARIDEKKSKLDALRPLPSAAVNRLKEQFTAEWIYNSNAIEGSTLTLRETQLILETGLTIGGKSLREHFEVTNHKDAIDYVESLAQQGELITPFHVRQIHKLVLSQIDDENAGQYRKTEVRIAGAKHIPPEAWETPQRMTEWGDWLKNAEKHIHSVELAAQAHHRLVAIHPFIDGNGRTARLVMNLILFRQGYPPAVILRVNRKQYYQVLMQADAGKNDPLVNFVGRAVDHSLTLYLEACVSKSMQLSSNEQWIPLAQAAAGTTYTQEYLSLLARQGRIEAIKRGRNWFTTRKAVKEYQDSIK